jgi:tetratricopeptide (TPR) repeat protein
MLAAFSAAIPASAARPKESELRLEVSRQWAEKGEYDKAVQELRLYLSEHPDSPDIYARIGALRMKQGNFKLAGENYKIALAKNPDLREAHEGLALAYEKAGDKAKAEEERKKLAALKPPPAVPREPANSPHEPAKPPAKPSPNPGAETHAAPRPAGHAPEGEASAAAAPAPVASNGPVDPNFSPALDSGASRGAEGIYAQKEFLEALEFYKQGKGEAAAAALRRCLNKTPGHPGAYYLGGVMRYEKGEYGKALFNFKRATDYPDRGFNAYYYMGRIYQKQERFNEAIPALEKYVSLTKSEPGRRQAEGYLAQMRGEAPKKTEPAAKDAKEAHGEGERGKDAHAEAAGEHGAEKAKPEAVDEGKAAAAALTRAEDDKAMVLGRDGNLFFLIPDAHSLSGKKLNDAYELCKKEKYEKAVNLLKETVLGYGGSDNADAANLDLASVYLRLGLWEGARDRLADYMGSGSRDSVRYYDPAQYLTGLAMLGLKNGEKAERALLRIKPGAANAPAQDEIDYRLAQAAELQKDGKKLSVYLEKAYASAKDPLRKAGLAQQQAFLFAKYGNVDKAMDQFRKSMADCKSPGTAEICSESQLRLADMSFKKKDWKGAMGQYRDFAAKYADHKESAWVHYQMANIYKLTGNFESALNEYKRVIDNYPESYWASQAKWKREDTIWQKEYEEVLD